MYRKNLSELFGDIRDNDHHEHTPYPWNWKYEIDKQPDKIFYSIGDSWLDRFHFSRVFKNNYPEYVNINRAIMGSSNSLMIDTIEKDMELLSKINIKIVFLVAFSEVGRSHQDLKFCSPKNHRSTHEYFAEILLSQYEKISQIIGKHDNYVTTAFISNNFNSNKTILDFCGDSDNEKPENVYSVYSNGIFEYLKDRHNIFDFTFSDDVNRSLMLKQYILSKQHIDDTLHPNSYQPYEKFLKNVFSNLKKSKDML